MAKISIIMPVYNSEKFLVESIESILKQSYEDFELILVNDGSSDNSGKICDDYRVRDERIKVLHQTNKGQAEARNAGIIEAKGQWIMFVDSDDIIHPQILEILLSLVEDTDAQIGMCDAQECETMPQIFKKHGDVKGSHFLVNEEIIKDIYEYGKHRYWTIWAKLINRNLLLKYPFSVGRIFEDNAVVPLWLINAGEIVDTKESLYFYRINTSGTTKSSFNLKKLDYLWALNEQISLYSALKYERMQYIIVNRYIDSLLFFYVKVKNELKDYKAARKIKRQFINIVCKNYKYIQLSKGLLKRTMITFYPNIKKVFLYFRDKGDIK